MKRNPDSNKNRARRYQHVADVLSIGRGVLGIVLGAEIASSQRARAPVIAASIAALSATDYIDGRLAAKAQELDGSISKKTGARVDQLSDKVMTNAVLTGLVINALRNKKYGYATILAANQLVQATRDIKVTPVRALAEKYDVDASARKGGKRKTFANTIALVGAALPMPEKYNKTADAASAVVLSAGSYLSVDSGIELVSELQRGISDKQATFALDDTIPELASDTLPSEFQ